MPSAVTAPPPAAQKSTWRTVGAVFFVHGMLFASWAAHIPHVKAHVGLSDGGLGFVLLATPIGSIAAMMLGAWLMPRVGSRRMVTACLVGYCCAGPFVGVAGSSRSAAGLFVALLCWGAFQGTLDVAMNTQALAYQHAVGRPIMSGMHGRWSLGALAGAGAGALGVGLGVSLTVQLIVLGVLSLPLVLWTLRLPDEAAEPEGEDKPERLSIRRWPKAVLLLAAVALASMLCEGAAADWSAVYLRNSLHAEAVVASLGYAFFTAAMVLARLSGDALIARRGAARVVAGLCVIATVGFAAGLASGNVVVALIGLAALGGGVATVVPTVFSAAGSLPGVPPSSGIAAVSACGWAGFVCGPPLIGQLASATSLPVALGVVPLLTAFIAVALSLRSPHVPGPAH